jgi:hypothetical protein
MVLMLTLLAWLPSSARAQPMGALAVPAQGAYTGAYIDFGDTEDDVTLTAIEAFEQLAGKRQAIVASSSYWGQGEFPAANVRLIANHGAAPLLYWSPWGPPYEQGREAKKRARTDPFNLQRIVAGECDGYIDRWAAGAREFGGPLLVSFGCEPNADWFPWGGKMNGADAPAKAAAADNVGFVGPELYKRAYRHAVDRVRAAGARNVSWVFHANNDSHPNRPWNAMAQYYPGPAYADWLGMSVYGQLTPGDGDEDWTEWPEAMNKAYKALCALDPAKPVMLAEWGVGEFPKSGDKAAWIRDAFQSMNGGRYPRLKAAVFWHERWQNDDESYSNLRVQSSPGALKAYRQGVAHPFWLDRPEFQPLPAAP